MGTTIKKCLGLLVIGILSASLLAYVTILDPDGKIVPLANMYDNSHNLIEGHDGGMIKVKSTYYWYGVDRTSTNTVGLYNKNFYSINMYSSTDLASWTFLNRILTHNSDTALQGTDTKIIDISRPKIIYNESTRKYVMYFHLDDQSGFGNPKGSKLGIATCDSIGGNYTYIRGFNPLGLDSRDMSAFVDDDGCGYIISATDKNSKTTIFKLTPDYLDVQKIVTNQLFGEGIALFKRRGLYYAIFSEFRDWVNSDNWYQTATSLTGPWSGRVTLADPGTHTYESQITYVIATPGNQDTTYMYMGDRWANGTVNSRYIWLPIKFNGTAMHMDLYKSWKINTVTGTWAP